MATDYFEGEKYISISGVIPIIKSFTQKFVPCDKNSRTTCLFKDAIHRQPVQRFSFAFAGTGGPSPDLSMSATNMSIATLLDPKFKGSYFTPVESIRVSWLYFLHLSFVNMIVFVFNQKTLLVTSNF